MDKAREKRIEDYFYYYFFAFYVSYQMCTHTCEHTMHTTMHSGIQIKLRDLLHYNSNQQILLVLFFWIPYLRRFGKSQKTLSGKILKVFILQEKNELNYYLDKAVSYCIKLFLNLLPCDCNRERQTKGHIQ